MTITLNQIFKDENPEILVHCFKERRDNGLFIIQSPGFHNNVFIFFGLALETFNEF